MKLKEPQKQNLERIPGVQRCFKSKETVQTSRDGEPRTATSTLTQLLSSSGILGSRLHVHCVISRGHVLRPITSLQRNK